jgi:hypothetical protein
MAPPVRTITPIPLDEGSWAPFGWLPVADTDPSDGTHRLEFDWDDVHVNRISHRRDEVPAVPGGLRCQMLFHHVTHTQVLMPLDVAAVVVVAAPSVPFTSASDIESARAFVLEPLRAVVLHRGTWHWGPFPIVAEAVELFNVQGLRYAEDNARADLEVLGTPVDVAVG